MLSATVDGNLDILMVSESKIDNSFPTAQFFINGYTKPYRLDRDCFGGGILLYVRQDIPSRPITCKFQNHAEYLLVEINLRKQKWLLCCVYNPHKQNLKKHLQYIEEELAKHSATYDNLLVIGDFNAEPSEIPLSDFAKMYGLHNLVKEPTCFKSQCNPTCIDLILTNKSSSFQHTNVVETGLSDFHKMTVTFMKTKFKKGKPNIQQYRDYKKFDHETFRGDLFKSLNETDFLGIDLEASLNKVMNTLNIHAPKKTKYLRTNQAPFMNKELNKAIMTRSRLRNKYLKNKSDENETAFKKQRNKCVKLVQKSKETYYNNLEIKSVTDNKKFWNTVKPCFTEKVKNKELITLVENEKTITDDLEIASIFNDYFCNLVPNLRIKLNENPQNDNIFNDKSIETSLSKFANHPSVVKIKQFYGESGKKLSFRRVSLSDVTKKIKDLDKNKTTQQSDIPTKIIQENSDIFGNVLCNSINYNIDQSNFPKSLKNADVIPVFKKEDRTDKCNYRPVSILPNISKIFEKCLYKQIEAFFQPIFNKQQCGFRRGFSTQQCLIAMIEKCKKSLDNKGSYAALLTDLSKAFDCINHDLLIAKLHAYGFDKDALRLIHSYLTGRKQRVKINNSFSTLLDILFGVPQGSILGPLLFNVFLIDLFLITIETDIASYADDNTPYTYGSDKNQVVEDLEKTAERMFIWFAENGMKANEAKSHLLSSLPLDTKAVVGDTYIENSDQQKLLGIKN